MAPSSNAREPVPSPPNFYDGWKNWFKEFKNEMHKVIIFNRIYFSLLPSRFFFQFLQSYATEVNFLPSRCYNVCLKSAKKYAGEDDSVVWETREFCKMGCDFPELKTM